MKCRTSIFVLLLTLLSISLCQNPSFINRLNEKGLIVIMRHAPADTCIDRVDLPLDSNWWTSCNPDCELVDCNDPLRLCDASVARQLSGDGIQLAKGLANAFGSFGVHFDHVYGSEFCRIIKTATHLNYDDVVTDPRITGGIYNISSYCNSAIELINEISENLQPNENALIITHKIADYGDYGADPDSVEYKICDGMHMYQQLDYFAYDPVLRDIAFEITTAASTIESVPVFRENTWVTISSTMGIITTVVVSLLMFSLLTWTFFLLLVQRKRYEVKMSSPIFLAIISIGCLISYGSIIMFFLEPNTISCMGRYYLMMIGFSFAYSSLIIKNYRIMVIFDVKEIDTHHTFLSNSSLLKSIVVVTLIYIVILVLWTIISPITVIETIEEPFIRLSCGSTNSISTIFIICLIVVTVLLLFAGVVISIRTRKAPALFREGMWIGFAIYTVILIGGITIPIGHIIMNTNHDLGTLILTLGICIWTTSIWGFIFMPKVHSILKYSHEHVVGKIQRAVHHSRSSTKGPTVSK